MRYALPLLLAIVLCGCKREEATPDAKAAPATVSLKEKSQPVYDALVRLKMDHESNVGRDTFASHLADAKVIEEKWLEGLTEDEKTHPATKAIRVALFVFGNFTFLDDFPEGLDKANAMTEHKHNAASALKKAKDALSALP